MRFLREQAEKVTIESQWLLDKRRTAAEPERPSLGLHHLFGVDRIVISTAELSAG
jgi:hypothetical protein